MRRASKTPLLIGVDGGATEVKAHQVVAVEEAGVSGFTTGPATAARLYDTVAGFEPAPIARQLVEAERQAFEMSATETEQAHLWIEATADVIASVAEQAARPRIIVGICMPGQKTVDQRGLAVVRNGPRSPEFLARLSAALGRRGIEIAAPIERLHSDADACGHGEELALDGNFRDVRSAHYVGGGTGIGEVVKLDGRVIGLDELAGVLVKAWRLESQLGGTFEDLLSVRGMNEAFARRTQRAVPFVHGEYVEERAFLGENIAIEVLCATADGLAELVHARLQALFAARAVVCERIVVGQRLGVLYADPRLREFLIDRTESALVERLRAHADPTLARALVDERSLKPGFLVPSTLREAPAIGAAALASRVPVRAPRARRSIG